MSPMTAASSRTTNDKAKTKWGKFMRATFPRCLRSAHPRVLPSEGDILKVPPVSDVSAVAITDFDGLMFAYGDRGGSPDPRVSLKRARVLHTIEACGATDPIVAIERHPQSRPEVVT